jgi:molecular chaperone GrpE
MARKRSKPKDDAHEAEEKLEQSEKETTPLDESKLEEILENDLEEVVTDITDAILPTHLSEDEINTLREQYEEAQRQADENLDGWQRARAEFANFKKRIEREKWEERARLKGEIACKYLSVLDDIERALKDVPENPEVESWAEGIDLIYRKMQSILESEGVELISTQGEVFDPNFHEAIAQDESDDHEEGEILEVLQQGYKIGDRVLRPAVVRVAK